VFLLVDEKHDERKFASGIHQTAGLNAATANESSHCVYNDGIGYILLAQVIEDLEMRWPALIFVRFIEINSHLDSHGRDCK